MKKMILLGALMTLCIAAVGHAQESRQDVSISGFGVLAPDVYGLNIHPMVTTHTGGFLASYRYLLTPRSAVEVNYSFFQNSIKYNPVSQPNSRVHSRGAGADGGVCVPADVQAVESVPGRRRWRGDLYADPGQRDDAEGFEAEICRLAACLAAAWRMS